MLHEKGIAIVRCLFLWSMGACGALYPLKGLRPLKLPWSAFGLRLLLPLLCLAAPGLCPSTARATLLSIIVPCAMLQHRFGHVFVHFRAPSKIAIMPSFQIALPGGRYSRKNSATPVILTARPISSLGRMRFLLTRTSGARISTGVSAISVEAMPAGA